MTTPGSGPRLRATIAQAAVRARAVAQRIAATESPSARPSGVGPGGIRPSFERLLKPGPLALEAETVTSLLYGRLGAEDVASVEALIRAEPGAWEHYFGTAEHATDHGLVLALGIWLGSERLIEKTGLIRAEPPEDVHAMTRGAQNAAGGLYEANLVIDALLSSGAEMSDVRRALDFGCSSGRVLRPLAAAYPHVAWQGCDPNERAVAWAGENVPGIGFFASGDLPPLPLDDGSLDLAYAISIWSHFKPARGLEWFDEMHRLIRSGGHLVATTHGLSSVAHYVAEKQRSDEQSQQIAERLYEQGWWYAAEFGEQGDWGVTDPQWGTAFVSPEWLLTQLCPRWRVVEFAPGRNQNNQDVYVFQRV